MPTVYLVFVNLIYNIMFKLIHINEKQETLVRKIETDVHCDIANNVSKIFIVATCEERMDYLCPLWFFKTN